MEYTFINNITKEEKVVVEYNILNAISKLGMVVSRIDRLTGSYLQSTKFEHRERIIWTGEYGNDMFIVKQNYY